MNQRTFSYGRNEQLTIDDLRAYRAGQLGGAALHRVERILLENPFYADALDGLDALQQVGENLHSHTRDLHLALQERVGETATPRRLMPLWVTSAAASIVLVICVAIYHFFYVVPAGSAASTGAVEPGTVLIDAKTLGIGEPEKIVPPPTTAATQRASAKATVVTTATVRSEANASGPVPHGQVSTSQPTPVLVAVPAKKSGVDNTLLAEDTDIIPLPVSQADLQRRQLIDTERAFER